jgi:hypothetical protein
MKLEPVHLESVVIDPRAVANNGVGDDAWSEEEFEEEEEKEEEEEQQEEGEEEGSEDGETAEGEEEEPVRVARALPPASRRQPGANPNAIVVELDENAVASHLLAALDLRSPPGVE